MFPSKLTLQLAAFLKTITYSEIGLAMIGLSDQGFNVIVGSTPAHMKLFTSYDDHPRQDVVINAHLRSDAAGAYQIESHIYDAYKKQLGLIDFSPGAQVAIALQLIKECQAIDLINAGNIELAIHACRSRWASFPNAGYQQHENVMADLVGYYHQQLNGGYMSISQEIASHIGTVKTAVDNIDNYAQWGLMIAPSNPQVQEFVTALDAVRNAVDAAANKYANLISPAQVSPPVVSAVPVTPKA